MSKMTLQRIGPLLLQKRAERGLREVAREVGISPATLSRVERGKVPDLETFSKLCKWLELDPGEVLGCPTIAEHGKAHQEEHPAVHFKTDRTLSPEAVNALAEMILAAQKMMMAR